jgi:hypothetical protein
MLREKPALSYATTAMMFGKNNYWKFFCVGMLGCSVIVDDGWEYILPHLHG